MKIVEMQARQVLLRTVVGALCATAAVAIWVLLTRRLNDTNGRILLTTTAISGCALLAVPAGMLLERGQRLLLARASAGLTLVWLVVTLTVVWGHDPPTGLWKTWGVLGTLALAAAQGCGVEGRRRDTDSPTVRGLVAAGSITGGLLAGLGVIAILTEISGDGFYRGLGALAIVDVLLVVVVAVLRRGTGPIGQTHRLRVDGRFVELPGRDFAAAVAAAIRDAERDGSVVKRIERA